MMETAITSMSLSPSTTSTTTTAPLSRRPHSTVRHTLALCIAAFLMLAMAHVERVSGEGALAEASGQRSRVTASRVKRMFALCPPHFERIGKQCYFLSAVRMNWLDAHFDCKDRNSQLAEPIKLEDRRLRSYLMRNDTTHSLKWIGGLFNWQKNQWQWGYSGRDMEYQSFSQMMPGSSQDLKFNCAVLNANLKYRWSARPCVEKHNFVCQHNMPYVSEMNRHKVYAKWNASYPNEMANEMEVILDDERKDGDRRRFVSHINRAIQTTTLSSDDRTDLQRQQTQRIDRPAIAAGGVGVNGRPSQRKRRPHQFNSTLIDSNGRFADRKISQSVSLGAQSTRRRTPMRQRRPTTAPTSDPINSNRLDSVQRQNDVDRLAEERSDRQLDAERREQHRRLKQQHNRRRKQKNAGLRKSQKQQQQQQQRETVHGPTLPIVPSERLPPTDVERREQQRMAETGRLLGIGGARPPPATVEPGRYPTATTDSSATTTLVRPAFGGQSIANVAMPGGIANGDSEEERQRRVEYERRQHEYQQQQDELERQQKLAAEQREREHAQQQRERDRLASERQQQEQRIQTEMRERQERERADNEQLEIDRRQRHEREERRRQAADEQRRQKAAQEAKLQRLKEKAVRNNDTVLDPADPTVVAAAEAAAAAAAAASSTDRNAESEERRQLDHLHAQQEKKRKREMIRQKLMKMTHEQQLEFLALRAERNRKRQVDNDGASAATTTEDGKR